LENELEETNPRLNYQSGRRLFLKAAFQGSVGLLACSAWSIAMAPLVQAKDIDRLVISTSAQRKHPFGADAELRGKNIAGLAVFGSLIDVSKSYVIVPGLLQSWHWDYKKKAYILKLRDNIRFHNGRKVSSKDLEFSIARWLFVPKRSYEKAGLLNIRGVDSIAPGAIYKSGSIEGLRIVDELTIQVELNSFNPSFMFALRSPSFSPVPSEDLESDLLTWKKLPIGAGPYKVESITQDGRTVLRKALPSEPGPKKVEISSNKEDKDIDLYIGTRDELGPQYKTVILENEYDSILIILFNYKSQLAQMADFRRAIFYGVDRNRIAKITPGSAPVTQLLTPLFPGYRKPALDKYASQATEYAARIPASLKAKTYKIPFFSTRGTDPYIQDIIASLKSLGFSFEVEYSTDKRGEAMDDGSPFRITRWGLGSIVDPIYPYVLLSKKSPLPNSIPVHNTRYEDQLEEALSAPSLDILVQKSIELSKIIEEEALAVSVVALPPVFYVKNDLKIYGLHDQRSAINFDLQKLRAE
jgi:ABC-type transport system substrate-binding protein